MRPEIMEYNYDWMMASTIINAAKLGDGTTKELDMALSYVNYCRGAAESFLAEGEVGIGVLKLFNKYYENVMAAHDNGKKVAITSFCFSPLIFNAMDVVPIIIELYTALGSIMWKRGMFDYLDYACEAGLPETSCSSQRGGLGAFTAGLCEPFDFVMVDTAGICDSNANAYAWAAAYMDKPFFQLNYPQTLGDDDTEAYHVEDFKAAVDFIEAQTGRSLDYDRLAEVLAEAERQDELVADLEDMATMIPSPVPPLYQVAIYVGRFTFHGLPEFTRLLEIMVAAAAERAKQGISGLQAGVEKARAYMFYIDHYTLNMNFLNWFRDNGVTHLGGMLSKAFHESIAYTQQLPGSTYGIDTSTPEAMLNSVAQINARFPMVRSIRGPYDQPNMWLEETLAMARHLNADCLIYNGTPGCRNTWANVKMIARDLEKHGYPTHIMYDDAFDDRVESWDATRERLDEFFQVRGLL